MATVRDELRAPAPELARLSAAVEQANLVAALPQAVTFDTAADALGVKPTTLRRMVRELRLFTVVIGKRPADGARERAAPPHHAHAVYRAAPRSRRRHRAEAAGTLDEYLVRLRRRAP